MMSLNPTIRRLLLCCATALITCAVHADSVVVFNELNYNPTGGTDDEWIELHSQMGINTDLSGWRLDNGVEFTFPQGTIIPAGGYLIVAKDPSNPALPSGALVVGPYNGSLSNGGEQVDLLSSADRVMDEVEYEDSGEWPIAADGGGVTLAKCNPGLSSGESAHWSVSAETGGTPGAENFTSEIMPSLLINEVSAGGDSSFFVEIRNVGATSINTDGYVLEIDGNNPGSISLMSVSLAAGAHLLLDQALLGQIPGDGDKLFLRTPGAAGVADARAVSDQLQGLSLEFLGKWIFPSAPTPGVANTFNLETDIVINEIFYNAPLLSSHPGVPPTVDTSELINANAVWRFNEAGDDLGTAWAQSAHSVGGNWESGPAIIGNDPGFPFTIATQVDATGSNDPFVRTYYFESDFSLTAQQADDLTALQLTHLIDDGAVFYLNGAEIHRVHMPDEEITAATFTSTSVNVAAYLTDNIEILSGLALEGTNRLSVEVHQNSVRSGDIIFGLEVSSVFVTAPGIPAIPRRESDQQWLELHNRGISAVDLSDWYFGEGIDFTFPQGTSLGAGAYLVLAKDPASVLVDHPGIDVVGPYLGSLSGGGETLTLLDATNNPADTLRYYDGDRWPSAPDGDGSSLELRDPDADNALPSAWAASDELARTTWQTYTYRGTAAASAVGPDGQWKEFILGMLDGGEVLLDDITVTEDPEGTAIAMLTDGSFESGTLNSWRARGNHRHASVIADPDDSGKKVLHLDATGSTEHMHNSLETTFAGGRTVVDGREYEISFRARLLSGTNLLHSRLYFNRLPFTTELERPTVIGTPGVANSTLIANLGPTGTSLIHSPAIPAAAESVTVSAELTDPDGIGTTTLYYSVNGGAFQQTPMSATGSGSEYAGTIPGQSAGLPVQFYIETTDSLGAVSFLPAEGPDSRAMFEVQDGRAATTGIKNIRLIMKPEDHTWMQTPINLMSNDRMPCTVIYGEDEIYYNTGVRLKSSQRGRGNAKRVGFNIRFPEDNLFRGFHRTIAIDRSEGGNTGQRDLLFDIMATSSRGVPGEFNDLCYIISPNSTHTSAAVLQMARFRSDFLDAQFEDGGDGTVYEFELVYYATTADAQGNKLPQPDSILRSSITSRGDNPEDYRWNFLIKNNEDFDDYSGVLNLVKLFDKFGAAFNAEVDQVLDVDQWLRALAYSAATGAGDSFFANSQHNGQFYSRPDGKMLYFPHDMDLGFSVTRNIFENNELKKLTADPARKRIYLGHLYDICSTVYNQSYMQDWTTQFDELVPGALVFNDDLSYINDRSNYILGQVNAQVSPVSFTISTNAGGNFTTDTSPIVIQGEGWVNVRELRLSGSNTALTVEWLDENTWQVSIPLLEGANQLIIEAYDFSGSLLDSDAITVTSTAVSNLPSPTSLVISEINYNPPGSEDTTEFIELLNISSPTITLDLTGVSFVAGIDFSFPSGFELAPGQRLLLVNNVVAFEAEYGAGLPVAGVFSGSLSNGGETLSLRLASGVPIQEFTYDDNDPWPNEPDGDGFSLVLLEPESAPDHGEAANWRSSVIEGGTPGSTDTISLSTWKAGFGNPADDSDADGDGWSVLEEYYLGGSPTEQDDLTPQFVFDFTNNTLTASMIKRANATGKLPKLYHSEQLDGWILLPDTVLLSSERLSGSLQTVDRLTWSGSLTYATEFFRFEFTTED